MVGFWLLYIKKFKNYLSQLRKSAREVQPAHTSLDTGQLCQVLWAFPQHSSSRVFSSLTQSPLSTRSTWLSQTLCRKSGSSSNPSTTLSELGIRFTRRRWSGWPSCTASISCSSESTLLCWGSTRSPCVLSGHCGAECDNGDCWSHLMWGSQHLGKA